MRWTVSTFIRLPADLALLLAVSLGTASSVFLPVVRDTPLRIGFGLVFLLFAPGYAIVSALFPEGRSSKRASDGIKTKDLPSGGSIGGLERLVLSVGLSVAIVPLVALGLNFTTFGIRLAPVIVSLLVIVVSLLMIAAYRRQALSSEDRFRVPWRGHFGNAFDSETRAETIANVFLAVTVLLAAGGVGYAVATPNPNQSFTNVYLLTENENGTLVTDDYPQSFTAGEPQELVVGIDNQEHETASYTVIVKVDRVRADDGSNTVLETEQLRQFNTRLSHNQTWRQPHSIAVPMIGDRLRLTYLVYRGEPPSNPTISNAYQEVHLWVSVTAP